MTATRSVNNSARRWLEKFGGDSFAQDIRLALPRLRRYALSLTRNPSAADDLVQETMARGIEKLHLWQSGTDLRVWLFAHTSTASAGRHARPP